MTLGTMIRTGTLGVLLAAGAVAARQDGHFYMYGKERVPMALDGARVAVFRQADPAARASARDALVRDLAGHGVPADSVTDTVVPGWSLVAMHAADARAAADPLAFVADLAKDPALEFVSPVFEDEYGMRIVTRDILIGFPRELRPDEADRILDGLGAGEVLDRAFAGNHNMYLVRSSARNGLDVLRTANTLAALPEVDWAEPDMVYTGRVHIIPNDALFGSQWHHRQASDVDMDSDQAWDIEPGDPSILTAVFDLGGQSGHPDMNSAGGADFSGNGTGGEPFNACDNHGTEVAGCIAAKFNNSIGVAGVAPNSRVLHVKIGTATASAPPCGTSYNGTTGAFVSAVSWAQMNGARVTNASLGFGVSGSVDTVYTNTRNLGVVHFASSGNGGNNSIGYPASSPSVNSVGAIGSSGSRASFSQYGTGLDFVAGGVGIWTTDRTGASGDSASDYVSTNGTSFSSPNCAGVAALILSANPLLTPTDVESIMQATATDLGAPGYDLEYGYGHVNSLAAVNATAPPAAPGPFSLVSPSSGAMNVTRWPSFSWSASFQASTYTLTVDDSADFSSPLLTEVLGSTSYDWAGGPLNAASTYFWKVEAQNMLGTTPSTPVSQSFTTISVPPASPVLTTPTPGATGVTLTPSFAWNAADFAESYTFQLDNDADFSSPIANSNVSVTAFSILSPLAPGTLHHWRVFANNPLGSTASTPVSATFTTLATPPSTFTLQAPSDGSTIMTLTPTLNWSDAAGAESYRLQVDNDLGFTSPELVVTGLTDSQYTVTMGQLANNVRHYWRVFAVNGVGETQCTPGVFNFAIVVPTCCPGNADKLAGAVTFTDVTTVLANWGQTYPNGNGQGDSDCNMTVNFADITSTLANFNNPCN